METKTEIVITQTGMFQAVTSYRPLDINSTIINQFTSTATRKTAAMFPGKILKDGPVRPIGFAAGPNHTAWTLEVDNLPLTTSFVTMEDGKTIYPVFTEPKLPTVNASWRVPRSMRLILLVTLGPSHELVSQHLVALDNSSRMFTLPLSNTYDDGKLCSGKYGEGFKSSFEAMSAAWNQFQRSRWQGDLYNATRLGDNTRAMFSFRMDGNSINQLFSFESSSADWQRYCTKIANETVMTSMASNPPKDLYYV